MCPSPGRFASYYGSQPGSYLGSQAEACLQDDRFPNVLGQRGECVLLWVVSVLPNASDTGGITTAEVLPDARACGSSRILEGHHVRLLWSSFFSASPQDQHGIIRREHNLSLNCCIDQSKSPVRPQHPAEHRTVIAHQSEPMHQKKAMWPQKLKLSHPSVTAKPLMKRESILLDIRVQRAICCCLLSVNCFVVCKHAH